MMLFPCCSDRQSGDRGFTVTEIMIVLVIMGVLMAIAIPNFLQWVPNYRLKEAARDLYSNMQRGKIGAIKSNSDWAIFFDTANDCYHLCSSPGADGDWAVVLDNTVVERVDLIRYGHGIGYGSGNATTGVPLTPIPGNNVSYTNNYVVFNPRGTGSGGYVYFDHRENTTTYAVGTTTSGAINLKRWMGSTWK